MKLQLPVPHQDTDNAVISLDLLLGPQLQWPINESGISKGKFTSVYRLVKQVKARKRRQNLIAVATLLLTAVHSPWMEASVTSDTHENKRW